MDIRTIFTRDLIADRELLATFVFCLAEVQVAPASRLFHGEVVDLRPYEVLIEFDRLEREIQMEKAQFVSHLELLQRMRRMTFKQEKDYCKVILAIELPIGSSNQTRRTGNQVQSIKFEQWTELDLEQIRIQGFSKDYLDMVRQILHRFMKVVGNKVINEITVYDYREYVRALQQGGASNSSVNNYRRALVASMNRAIRAGYLTKNPIESEKPLPVNRSRPKIVEREDMKILREHINLAWLHNVIDFALLSTKRHGEILHLKWDDIDSEAGKIWIHSSEKYRVKFNKEQDLPLSEPLKALLKRIEDEQRTNGVESDYVFVDEKGKHLREKKVQEAMKEARESAGLEPHITIHGLRRTTSTKLRQKNVSTNTIKGILNHENEKTTNRYLGVPREDELDALNKLSLSDFLP